MEPHSNIIPIFPPGGATPASPETPARDTAPPLPLIRNRDVHLAEIARRLGIADRNWRYIIDTVRLLNDRYSFPDPKNPRIVHRDGAAVWLRGPRAIVRRSLFPRARVEEWFDHHRSPAQRDAEDRGEAREVAAVLTANSRQLVASLAGRKRA